MLKAVTRCTEIKTRTCKKGHKNLPDQEEEAYDALQLRPKWWCFQKIKRSLYTCKVPKLPDVEKQCSCEGENKCYDITCENWMISVECPAECGKTCRNHRLGQGSTVTEFLLPYYTGSRGAGLKTTRNIREGELVIEYLGEILDDAEYRRRLSTTYKDYSAYYAFSLDKKLLIDSTIKGNFSRFINHSCHPNCVAQRWQVGDKWRIGIFAAREIRGGEELTYSYNFEPFDKSMEEACLCGSSFCKGTMLVSAEKIKPSKDANSQHKCWICEKKFDTRAAMRNHKYNAHDNRDHVCLCRGCNKRFTQKSTLDRHIREFHSGKQKCRKCHKWFSNKGRLRYHTKKEHNE